MAPEEKQKVENLISEIGFLLNRWLGTQYSAGYDGPRPVDEKYFKAAKAVVNAYPALRRSLFPTPEVEQLENELRAMRRQFEQVDWNRRQAVREREDLKRKVKTSERFCFFSGVAIATIIIAIISKFTHWGL